MNGYLVKYTIYFTKSNISIKGEMQIEEGVSFRDNIGRVIIVINEEEAKEYVSNIYEIEGVCELIKVPKNLLDGVKVIGKNKISTKLIFNTVTEY